MANMVSVESACTVHIGTRTTTREVIPHTWRKKLFHGNVYESESAPRSNQRKAAKVESEEEDEEEEEDDGGEDADMAEDKVQDLVLSESKEEE